MGASPRIARPGPVVSTALVGASDRSCVGRHCAASAGEATPRSTDSLGGVERLAPPARTASRCESRGMKGQTTKRRRCTECRRWYRPHRQSQHNQQTCGLSACQRRRRNRIARRRRERELAIFREEERRRQRRRRATQKSPGPLGVSRACASAKPMKIIDQFLKKWNGEERVSRACFERELVKIIEEISQKVGQGGP